jgi:hypothetical protein
MLDFGKLLDEWEEDQTSKAKAPHTTKPKSATGSHRGSSGGSGGGWADFTREAERYAQAAAQFDQAVLEEETQREAEAEQRDEWENIYDADIEGYTDFHEIFSKEKLYNKKNELIGIRFTGASIETGQTETHTFYFRTQTFDIS